MKNTNTLRDLTNNDHFRGITMLLSGEWDFSTNNDTSRQKRA